MLQNKIALVTGASRGIGRAIARTFAEHGATVIVNYQGSEVCAKELVKEIEDNGGKAEAVCCNVADFAGCERMIKGIIDKYGRLDILVNNAGITKDGLVMKMSEEEFSRVVSVNLQGTFHTIRHAARYMVKNRAGKIINISSVSGVLGNPGQANYSASKAGVIGLTKSVAKELGSRGIQVNAIAPGFITTDMTDAMSESAKETVLSQVTLGRCGKPEDVANAALFLASEMSDYITGQVLSVDGGMAY